MWKIIDVFHNEWFNMLKNCAYPVCLHHNWCMVYFTGGRREGWLPSRLRRVVCFSEKRAAVPGLALSHPTNEDLSLGTPPWAMLFSFYGRVFAAAPRSLFFGESARVPARSCPDTNRQDGRSDGACGVRGPSHPRRKDKGAPRVGHPERGYAAFPGLAPSHPTNEDLFLHPNEQRRLAGDPESVGTPAWAIFFPSLREGFSRLRSLFFGKMRWPQGPEGRCCLR